MKIVVLSDIHGDLKYLPKAKKYISEADLILLSGDITNFGGTEEVSAIITEIRNFNDNIFAVHGNCDTSEVIGFLNNNQISLHGNVKDFNGIRLAGLGGSLLGAGNTPSQYSEDEYSDILQNINVPGAELVFLSHTPPNKTKVDKVGHMHHAGSKSLRTFIEKRKPLACFSGHIHESRGIDYIGKTLLVNPGPFRAGYLTCAEYVNGEITAEIITL